MTGTIRIKPLVPAVWAPRLSMATVWGGLPTLLVAVVVWTSTDFPVDFWMHANLGRAMWQQHASIHADTFTHTIAGCPVVNQAWVAQLAFFAMARTGGYPLTQFLAGLVYAAGFGLISYVTFRRSGSIRITAALTLLTIATAMSNLAVRPQMFSVLLFGILLAILWTWMPRWTMVLGAGIVQLLWTNTHGAFPLGVVLPGIFLVGRAADVARHAGLNSVARDRYVRCYLGCCLAAAAIVFVNPNGPRVLDYVTGVTSLATSRNIEEWLPPTLATTTGRALFGSITVVLVVLGLSRKVVTVSDLLLLLAMLVLAAKSQRMVIWWACVLAPVLAPYAVAVLDHLFPRVKPAEQRTFHNAVVFGAVLLFVFFATPWTRCDNILLPATKRSRTPQAVPTGVVQFLRQRHYRGRLYQPMEWGALLSWELDPGAKVFVDSRIDFFPDPVWNDYVLISRRPDLAERILDRYAVDTVVWDRRRRPGLVRVLEQSKHWRRAYQDDLAVVYQRVAPDAAVVLSHAG